MKKYMLVVFAVSIIAQFFLFADGETYTEVSDLGTTRIISAYKNEKTGNLPELSITIRLLNSVGSEFDDSSKLTLPVEARGSYYKAFDWILAGNSFGQTTLSFSFSRMSLNGDNTNQVTEYFPYKVKMVYSSSKVGNNTIQMNTTSTAQAYVSNSFTGTTYRMKYADSISNGAVASLGTAGGEHPSDDDVGNPFSFSLVYDMSSNTKVEDANAQNKKSEYISGVTQNGHANVCDYWNRTGSVYVKLLVNNDRTWSTNTNNKVRAGQYYANVTVGVSVQ